MGCPWEHCGSTVGASLVGFGLVGFSCAGVIAGDFQIDHKTQETCRSIKSQETSASHESWKTTQCCDQETAGDFQINHKLQETSGLMTNLGFHVNEIAGDLQINWKLQETSGSIMSCRRLPDRQ